MMSYIQITYFFKAITNCEKNASLFVPILQILLMSCQCSLVFNTRIGTDSESTTINKTLK